MAMAGTQSCRAQGVKWTASHVPTSPRSHALRVGGSPRSEFLLIPFGRVEVDRAISGGDFSFSRQHAAQAVEWFAGLGRKLAIDYEHQSLSELNTRPDGLVPAAGWIGKLEPRGDGLWAAEVEWTDVAAGMLARGEYAYMSPVIFWGDDKQTDLKALGPVALTNDPATKRARPLVAASAFRSNPGILGPSNPYAHTPVFALTHVLQQEDGPSAGNQKGGPRMDRLRELLGLPADAPEDEVIAAAIAALEAAAGGGTGGEDGGGGGAAREGGSSGVTGRDAGRAEALATIAKRLELGEVTDVDALVAAIRKLPAGDGGGAVSVLQGQVKQLSTAVEGLRSQNATLVEANQRAEFNAMIGGAAHAGKIEPSKADKYFALFCSDRAMFETVLGDMPAKVQARTVFRGGPAPAAASTGTTTDEWKAAFRKDAGLRAEFGHEETYVAYMKAEHAGQVHVLKR